MKKSLAMKKFLKYVKYYEPSFSQNTTKDNVPIPNTWSTCSNKFIADCDYCRVRIGCEEAGLLTDEEIKIIKKEYPEYFL